MASSAGALICSIQKAFKSVWSKKKESHMKGFKGHMDSSWCFWWSAVKKSRSLWSIQLIFSQSQYLNHTFIPPPLPLSVPFLFFWPLQPLKRVQTRRRGCAPQHYTPMKWLNCSPWATSAPGMKRCMCLCFLIVSVCCVCVCVCSFPLRPSSLLTLSIYVWLSSCDNGPLTLSPSWHQHNKLLCVLSTG